MSLFGLISSFVTGVQYFKLNALYCEKHTTEATQPWQENVLCLIMNLTVSFPHNTLFFVFCTNKLHFLPSPNASPTMISVKDISDYNYEGEWGSTKGTTSGLWQSYLHIAPEVKYWFSAKAHHSQERCATLVKEPWTPRGTMGERRGGQTGKKKKKAITGVLQG